MRSQRDGEQRTRGRTIDTLILAFLINIVETSEHFDGTNVGTRIIDNALAPVLDQVFKQLQSLSGIRPWHANRSGIDIRDAPCRSVATDEPPSP